MDIVPDDWGVQLEDNRTLTVFPPGDPDGELAITVGLTVHSAGIVEAYVAYPADERHTLVGIISDCYHAGK